MAAATQAEETPEIQDEYTIRPDEVTKEEFAELAGWTSVRNVENLIKAGKISFTQQRRRIKGVVRNKVTIFDRQVVLDYINPDKDFKGATVVKEKDELETKNTEQEFLNRSQLFVAENLGRFADAMNQFTETVKPQLPPAQSEPAALFLTLEEAAEISRLSITGIKDLIAAEILTQYKGKNGKVMISRKQLLNL